MSLDKLPSVELVDLYKNMNDQGAAELLVRRYAARLIGLARAKLPGRLKRRLDPEDIMQSVCRTFFVRVRDGRLEVRADGDLWDLLATITMRKFFGQMDHHDAAKRAVKRESEPATDGSVCLQPDGMSREPNPEDVTALQEELDRVLADMEPHHREMVNLSLDEHTPEEISGKCGYSARQVRNVVNDFRDRLRQRLQ